MIRAVYIDGRIQALEPLPTSWRAGQNLCISEAEPSAPAVVTADGATAWLREMDEVTAQLDDPAEWAAFDKSLAEADAMAKEQVRRQMGLP